MDVWIELQRKVGEYVDGEEDQSQFENGIERVSVSFRCSTSTSQLSVAAPPFHVLLVRCLASSLESVTHIWLMCVCSVICFFQLSSIEYDLVTAMRIATVGNLLSGLLLLVKSKVTGMYTCPDLFVAPFLLASAQILSNNLPSDIESQRISYIFVLLIACTLIGLSLILSKELKFNRVVSFFPYSVICTFFLAIGSILICLSYSMCFNSYRHFEPVLNFCNMYWYFFPTVLFGFVQTWMIGRGFSTMGSFIFLCLLSCVCSYIYLFFHSMSGEWLFTWIPTEEGQLQRKVIFIEIGTTLNKIDFASVCKCVPHMLALTAMSFMKCSLQITEASPYQDLAVDDELGVLGGAAVLAGCVSGIPTVSIHFLKTNDKSSRAQGIPVSYMKASGVITLVGLYFLAWFGPQLVRMLPSFVFSGLLLSQGLLLVGQWIDSVRKKVPLIEALLILMLLVTFILFGLFYAVGLGIAAALLLFVYQEHQISVIRTEGTGLEWRSLMQHSLKENKWLDMHGDLIHVIDLQGVLFFGNANSLYHRVKKIMERKELVVPLFIIFNFPMVIGIDGSALDAFTRIWRLTKEVGTVLIITDPLPLVDRYLRRDSRIGEYYSLMPNLDRALAFSEAALLRRISRVHEEIMREADEMKAQAPAEGFIYCLKQMQTRFNIDTTPLAQLAPYVTPITLQPKEYLFPQVHGADTTEGGLYFIEHGFITVQREASQLGEPVMGPFCFRQDTSPRLRRCVSFRLATISTGFCIGSNELCLGQRSLGTYCAETYCRVHYLPFLTIKELEAIKPDVILCLYKLMGSHISSSYDRVADQLCQLNRRIYGAVAK